ncbi:MAG: gas vesicle protein GvpF [Herbinix sp.]|jgi:hypothetical protein|nr:gas vesicle protein GvpF [Herbinix sp.]
MDDNNLYVYCIAFLSADKVLAIKGHQDQLIYRVVYKDLAAFVSKTSCTHIDATYDNLQCHEKVITQLMKDSDVLPMNFTTIFKSERSVIEMLQRYYDQLLRNLEHITGKIELGIKVFYKLNFENEDKKDKELLNSPKEYMMKRYERFCNRQLKVDEILSVIEEQHKLLAATAVDNCYKEPLKNNLIFNASYLIKKEKKEEFDRIVADMIIKNPTYKIFYSGPWPAYHFVSIVQEGEENE